MGRGNAPSSFQKMKMAVRSNHLKSTMSHTLPICPNILYYFDNPRSSYNKIPSNDMEEGLTLGRWRYWRKRQQRGGVIICSQKTFTDDFGLSQESATPTSHTQTQPRKYHWYWYQKLCQSGTDQE